MVTRSVLLDSRACEIKNDRHGHRTALDLPVPGRLIGMIEADKEKEREKDESSSVTRD